MVVGRLGKTLNPKWKRICSHRAPNKGNSRTCDVAAIDMYQFGKGYKVIGTPANHSESQYAAYYYQWCTLPGVAGLPKLLQEQNYDTEKVKEPRSTSKELLKKETGENFHPWEQVKTTTNLKEHKD